MTQNNIIKIKTYKRKILLQYFVNACKYGWTGKVDNIVDFEWHRDNKKIKNIKTNKLYRIFTKILLFINLGLLVYLIYLITYTYL